MPLTPSVTGVGATGYPSTSGAAHEAEPAECDGGRNKSLLEGVVRLSRVWLDRCLLLNGGA